MAREADGRREEGHELDRRRNMGMSMGIGRRTVKWTVIVLFVSLTAFLGSFNATMVKIIDQRRDEIDTRRKLAAATSSKPPPTTPSENAVSIDEAAHQSLLEEHRDEVRFQLDERRRQQQRQEEAKKKSRERELSNPTRGGYFTTVRELDGFPARKKRKPALLPPADRREDDADADADGDVTQLYVRPASRDYNRQSHCHSTPDPTSSSSSSSSTALSSDAHFAKALRMLSSDFDRIPNGGNALPERVYGGNYRQDVEENGRGEGFVKTSVFRRGGGGSGIGGRGKRRRERSKGGVSGGEHADGNVETTGRGMKFVAVVMDILEEWIVRFLDYLHDVFGIDGDYYGSSTSSGSGSGRGNGVHDHQHYFGASIPEEDVFSWRDTRVGNQLLWISGKVAKLWSRRTSGTAFSSTNDGSRGSSKRYGHASDYNEHTERARPPSLQQPNFQSAMSLSNEDELAREGLFHLEKAAELGHAEAQRMVANALASGILPLSDHSLLRRIRSFSDHNNNSTSPTLTKRPLQVPDDFSTGGEQLSRAILLWHLSAMDGNVESAMALGYRHLFSANGGKSTSLLDSHSFSHKYYDPDTGGPTDHHGSNPNSHYGVLGTCPTALAYYEAAAHGVMDELESGPTKAKVNPPLDEHRLAEIYMRGGASVKLEGYNKPDEIEEALQYYRMLASRNHYPEPDLLAAFTIANFYYFGLRGVKQDLRLALKYYEICGDYNHWEGGGKAGLMHVWAVGMTLEERDLGKAYAYFKQGTPGGIDGCVDRLKKKKKTGKKSDDDVDDEEEVNLCDRHCMNGMGLVHLLGIDGLVERNVGLARRWFELTRDIGDPDGMYNYAMLRLGWMVSEVGDSLTHQPSINIAPFNNLSANSASQASNPIELSYMSLRRNIPEPNTDDKYTGPSVSDFNVAVQELTSAASKGHLQAKHKLGILYSTGADAFKKSNTQPTKALSQSCIKAVKYFKSAAEGGHTISRRIRAAWKQYNAGDYESSLRNYLAAAETGSEVGQINAAFLLERGHCLGMTVEECTRASIRLWRAAARQGNAEACLRVGDFYYYGRMKKHRRRKLAQFRPEENGETKFLYDEEDDGSFLSTVEGKAFYFAPGPYRWVRYVLYPEELVALSRTWFRRSMKIIRRLVNGGDAPLLPDGTSCPMFNEVFGTCSPQQSDLTSTDLVGEDEEDHMAIAAHYYRKAAEDHNSARANFNLGFMHEWGLGLTQDFPLAKRHYDLAAEGEDGVLASTIALFAMRVHETIVKTGLNW
eukprot:CAMPEP_0171367950 /NCGR_PEP_ID=MMETSP0879-20121228/6413_1 /TAXON_ID=67004 /ORGANISM="Thalassiosira weissflogii, Strain CCMP1336" /LENGTH=1259 /DNA_ID=CAMNT_0011876063 /DNA_START=61 /DNA_END=3837 /DNA_ORIENTATION=-